MRPRLSILMSVRNGATFLEETLDRLVAEIDESTEIIAVDDHSSDESFSILERFPISVFRLEGESGLAAGRNLAVHNARGDFSTFFDQDDLALPEAFSSRLNFLLAHPEAVAVAGQFSDVIDEKGRSRGNFFSITGRQPSQAKLTRADIPAGVFPGALWLYLFRTSALRAVGKFDPQWHLLCDQDFLIRFISLYNVERILTPVADYRVHDRNSSVEWCEGNLQVRWQAKAMGALLSLKYKDKVGPSE